MTSKSYFSPTPAKQTKLFEEPSIGDNPHTYVQGAPMSASVQSALFPKSSLQASSYSTNPVPYPKTRTYTKGGSNPSQGSENNCYAQIAKQIGNTKFTSDGKIYKECVIGGKTYQVEALGKGDSFQCYRSSTYVIKVFLSLLDTSKTKKRPPTVQDFDNRMDHLKNNYFAAQKLGISCALIYNQETLKIDGCVLQEHTEPVYISWRKNTPLQPHEKHLIHSFCEILKKAIVDPRFDWDLMPKNFGTDAMGNLKLFDFSDRPLDNQSKYFDQAIKNWINENDEAASIINQHISKPQDQSIDSEKNLTPADQNFETFSTNL